MTYKVKTLPLHTIETAPDKAKPLLAQAKSQLGFVPNMYGAMANEPPLLDAYFSGYASFRAESGFSPIEQEVIFLTISRENGCEYCVAAHSLVADAMSKVPTPVTDAIRDRRSVPDSKLSVLVDFAAKMVSSRGRPTDADVEVFRAAGYSERNILGVILAISVKTLSNYTNHIFHTPLDEAFAGRIWTQV